MRGRDGWSCEKILCLVKGLAALARRMFVGAGAATLHVHPD